MPDFRTSEDIFGSQAPIYDRWGYEATDYVAAALTPDEPLVEHDRLSLPTPGFTVESGNTVLERLEPAQLGDLITLLEKHVQRELSPRVSAEPADIVAETLATFIERRNDCEAAERPPIRPGMLAAHLARMSERRVNAAHRQARQEVEACGLAGWTQAGVPDYLPTGQIEDALLLRSLVSHLSGAEKALAAALMEDASLTGRDLVLLRFAENEHSARRLRRNLHEKLRGIARMPLEDDDYWIEYGMERGYSKTGR